MKISVIFARTINNVFGVDGKLPWKLKFDMQYFKSTTINKVVIMGRKTFESLGSVGLAHRTNIVVSKTLNPEDTLKAHDCWVVGSLEEALKLAEDLKQKEVFIIGGKNLIERGICLADELHVTNIGTYIYPSTPNVVRLDIYDQFEDNDSVKFLSKSEANTYKENIFGIETHLDARELHKDSEEMKFTITHFKRRVK